MTTTTRSRVRDRRRGFTLTEIIVATGLSGIILAGVLGSFLFLGRAGIGLRQYAEMETQARHAMETFALDVRMAEAITWHSANSLTVAIPTGAGKKDITYTYAPGQGAFIRAEGADRRTLIQGITEFNFTAYSISTAPIAFGNLAAASNETKQVQIALTTSRSAATVASTTNSVISARFILRNKRVTA